MAAIRLCRFVIQDTLYLAHPRLRPDDQRPGHLAHPHPAAPLPAAAAPVHGVAPLRPPGAGARPTRRHHHRDSADPPGAGLCPARRPAGRSRALRQHPAAARLCAARHQPHPGSRPGCGRGGDGDHRADTLCRRGSGQVSRRCAHPRRAVRRPAARPRPAAPGLAHRLHQPPGAVGLHHRCGDLHHRHPARGADRDSGAARSELWRNPARIGYPGDGDQPGDQRLWTDRSGPARPGARPPAPRPHPAPRSSVVPPRWYWWHWPSPSRP